MRINLLRCDLRFEKVVDMRPKGPDLLKDLEEFQLPARVFLTSPDWNLLMKPNAGAIDALESLTFSPAALNKLS